MPFHPFFGEGSPTRIDCRKKGYPYCNLSTGGPRLFLSLVQLELAEPRVSERFEADEDALAAFVAEHEASGRARLGILQKQVRGGQLLKPVAGQKRSSPTKIRSCSNISYVFISGWVMLASWLAPGS